MRGVFDFVAILLGVLLGLVALLVLVNTAPTVANNAALMTANQSAGGIGQNQSAAAIAIWPQFSTLWTVTGLAILIGILIMVFGRKG